MFTWNEKYSVGFDEIDTQHKKFLILTDEVRDLIGKGEHENTVLNKVNELFNYAKWHFDTENIYMKKCRYEYVEEHSNEHKKIIEKIQVLRNDLGKFDADFGTELMLLVKDWFLNHLLTTDRKLYNCIKERNMEDEIIFDK